MYRMADETMSGEAIGGDTPKEANTLGKTKDSGKSAVYVVSSTRHAYASGIVLPLSHTLNPV